MSFTEKPLVANEVRKENEIRISEIGLPPAGVSTLETLNIDNPASENLFISTSQSNFHVPGIRDNLTMNSSERSKNMYTKQYKSNIDAELSSSNICSEDLLKNTSSNPHCHSTSPCCTGSTNVEVPTSPKSQKSISQSPLPHHTLDKFTALPMSETQNLESVKINFIPVPVATGIPLPEQILNCSPPPLPSYEPKIPYANTTSAKYTENLSKATKNDSLDSTSNKFNLEMNSFETADANSKKFEDILPKCKNFPLTTSASFSIVDLNEKNDESRYSPSRLDSDDEGGECTSTKPKVLGKEQAKKRLMAFSLAKQPANPVMKKQNKLITTIKVPKEKPPNPNKSANIQEQFRATISAIEEEKKKMMQNMPNYLSLYRNNLSQVCDSIIPNTLNDKANKDETANHDCLTKFNIDRDDKESSRSNGNISSPVRLKGSRQRRSSSSRRSSSRSRRFARERNDKKDNLEYLKKMETVVNWNSFVEAGLELNADFRRSKLLVENKYNRKDRKRSRSPEEKTEHKPIFNYYKKSFRLMMALQAKASNPNINITVPFQEKTVKYTRTKPMITWAENPSFATDFFMSKQMLLDNCDKSISSILYDIMEQRCGTQPEAKKIKQRFWYPHFNYLVESENISLSNFDKSIIDTHFEENLNEEGGERESASDKLSNIGQNREFIENSLNQKSFYCKTENEDELEKNSSKIEKNRKSEEIALDCQLSRRRTDFVNDDYLSDVDIHQFPVKEVVLGDVKVQLDLDTKSVKVRSKWDSDYEGEEMDKEAWKKFTKVEKAECPILSTPSEIARTPVELTSIGTDKCLNNTESIIDKVEVKVEKISNKMYLPTPNKEAQNVIVLEEDPKGNLVSEYEEFMKIVSFSAEGNKIIKSEEFSLCNANLEEVNSNKVEKTLNKKVEITDWDQESDREEKPSLKKIPYVKDNSRDSFSLLLPGYDSRKQKTSKSPQKKKFGKTKNKTKAKKSSKMKKKHVEESSSESTSDSSDSDSDSNSDSDSDSDSSDIKDRKSKKKKKSAKKFKKGYSSSSDSDDGFDVKSSKSMKKKKKNATRRDGEDSSDSNEEKQSVMLKQLDFKKQEIIKKIEEIDSVNCKDHKKKSKDTVRRDCVESEESGKNSRNDRKKTETKIVAKSKNVDENFKIRKKFNITLLEESDESTSERENVDSKKEKKSRKKPTKRTSSTDSSSDGDEKVRRKEKYFRNSKKKKANYSSSSESDSDSYSSKSKKKIKKKKKNKKRKKVHAEKVLLETSHKLCDWNDHLLSDGPDFKPEILFPNKTEESCWFRDQLQWSRQSKVSQGEKGRKEHKDLGDWEESSSEDSPPEMRSRESTWDEDFPKTEMNLLSKDDDLSSNKTLSNRNFLGGECRDRFLNDFNLESDRDSLFIEKNANIMADRDIFSSENSASMQLFPSLKKKSSNANAVENVLKTRSQEIAADLDRENKKSQKDELYSPGHTESDLSDATEKKENDVKKEIRSKDIYDPLNCDSDDSTDKVEISKIPLPIQNDALNLDEIKKASENPLKEPNLTNDQIISKSEFIAVPLANEGVVSAPDFLELPERKRMISVKLQQKFQCKVASVFQSDSDEEESIALKKNKTLDNEVKSNTVDKENEKPLISEISKKSATKVDDKKRIEEKKVRGRERSRERRSKDRQRENSGRFGSPRHGSRTPDSKSYDKDSGNRRRKADATARFEDEDFRKEMEHSTEKTHYDKGQSVDKEKKSEEDSVTDGVRPIPVLTGIDVRIADGHSWGRPHMLDAEEIPYDCDRFDLINPDQIDFYESRCEKSNMLYNLNDKRYGRFDQDYVDGFDHMGNSRLRKDKRKSRSRSSSPKKRRRSKTPDRRRSPRNRSPRHRSSSPRRRCISPFSPRRRGSPRRKYKGSKSPERKKSRSPRKRRLSPSRRSRSMSPRKHRSRMDSPRRSVSPGKSASPRRRAIGVRNLIHVVGVPNDDLDMEMNQIVKSKYDSPMGFTRSLADSTISDSELNNSFYNRDYAGEYGAPIYPEEVALNNLITLQNHDVGKQTDSPKRLTLDQRIEIELGVPPGQNDQYQTYQHFPDVHSNQYRNSYSCDNGIGGNGNQNFYQSHGSDFNDQFFNGQQPAPNMCQFPQYPQHNTPGMQNSVLQVGNIMEVVPTIQGPPQVPVTHGKGHQIMQVGNVLQVVPTPKTPQAVSAHNYGGTTNVTSENIKGSVVIPHNVVPNAESIINPLIKAIQLEREKRKKEKEKRRVEREARRKARQLRREAKLLSVNEKLKKSVQDEGLMLGQEVEEDELLEEIEHPSPPVPVEIITDSSQYTLPPAGKGILITAGFVPKPASEKKEVKFADGICPGEGTSTSGGEDRASPPPKPKLPKEKRYKKKKTKLKKKVKVHIIRQVIQADDDDDEGDLSPPPPPPGDPPPIFFARFPFDSKAQYPVYQSQTTTTTTTTLTTVQFPTQSYQ